jgi:hypothetical protein
MRPRALAVVCIALGLVAGAAVARAENAKAAAMEHLVRGSKLYDQGHYDEAIAELKAGYALEARPDFLYALGQAERKRGDCKAAVAWYQRYVESGPSTQRTVATLVQIDRCKQELAASSPTKPPPPVAQTAPPVAQTAPPVAQTAPRAVETPPPVVSRPPSTVETPVPSEPAPVAATAAPARDTGPRASTPLYKRWWLWTIVAVVVAGGVATGVAVALTQRSAFDSTLPDLTWGAAALRVHF